MTVGELNVDPAGKQPVLIVAYQTSAPLASPSIDAVADALLKQTKDFDTARIEIREKGPFAGTTGVLIGGTHMDKGTPKRFAQYVAVGANGRAVRMIVSANEGPFKELQPAIGAIAQSIAFK